MRCRATRIIALLLVIVTAVGPSDRATAQDAPTAAAASSGAIQEPLIQAVLEELPAPPAFLRLVRTILQPGSAVPLHSHPGPAFNLVESGSVAIEVDGPAVVAQDGAADAAGQAPIGEVFDLGPGDQIVYPAKTPFAFANQTEEPARLLSLLVVPAGEDRPPVTEWADGTPTAGELDGVADEVVGQAISVSWPPGPLLIVVDRLALGPGQGIPPSGGPVMLAVETGSLGFSVLDGEFQISRGQADLEAIGTPTGSYRLDEGDAVFFAAESSAVPRGQEDGLLVLVRLSILPIGDAAANDPEPTPSDGDDAPTPSARRSTGSATTGAADERVADRNPLLSPAGDRLGIQPSTVGAVGARSADGRDFGVVGPPEPGAGSRRHPVHIGADIDAGNARRGRLRYPVHVRADPISVGRGPFARRAAS